jgi:4-diphosphocytidyl-2-C-methyl-D-erythritol kinase
MQAFAKINLFLDVVRRRPDGYHDIVSVMQSVSLCDDLRIEWLPGENSRVQLFCDEPGLAVDESNLVVRAAMVLIREYGICGEFRIFLTKRVPLGAGLAGGSSDCAATLHGINKLCNLNIPFTRLLEIGKSLGADVPFCLTGGTALTEGIGEKITPLTPHPPCFILIVCPKIHISTAEIFAQLGTLSPNPAISDTLHAISKKNLQQIATSFYNIFTPLSSATHPTIPSIINQLLSLGALGAQMSGTGSAVYAYFQSKNTANKALSIMKSKHNAFLTSPK